MSIQGGGRGGGVGDGGGGGGGGRGRETSGSSILSAAPVPRRNTGGRGGVILPSAASGARINTGVGGVLPRAGLGPRVGMDSGGKGILPSAAPEHLKDIGGGSATNPCVPPQSPIGAESQAEDRSFVPPLTIPTALFLRPYKPRKIVVPRLPPMKIEVAKPDPSELSMIRHEMSALRTPLLQAFVDSATFYAEGITLREYFATALNKIGDNGNRLLRKVKLPKKNAQRVRLTDEGCAILCSWICLFTRNHVANLSWDGAFDLDSFIVLHGQVHAIKPPKPRLATHSERQNDFKELAKLIKSFFILDGQYPPYLSHLINKLTKLPHGPLLESHRVAFETHYCLLTPIGGSNALYQLKVKFDGLVHEKRQDFVDVLNLGTPPPMSWLKKVQVLEIFKQIYDWGVEAGGAGAGKKRIPYSNTSTSAFIFIRNYTAHVSKNSVDSNGRQLFSVDGAELMVAEEFGDFVPDMWFNMVHNKLNFNLAVEEIAKNCMPSPTQVMSKRVDIFNSSSKKAKGGDAIISQGQGSLSDNVKGGGSNEKPEHAMTYEDLLSRNKQLERGAQISVVLSKQMRGLCAKVGSEVPKEVIEIEKLMEEIGVGSSEVLCPKSEQVQEIVVQSEEATSYQASEQVEPKHM